MADDDIRVSRFACGDDELVVFSVATARTGALVASLTPAEQDVCQLVLLGLSNAAIARQRGTSQNTVSNQLGALYEKLGVSSRSELAALLVPEFGDDTAEAG